MLNLNIYVFLLLLTCTTGVIGSLQRHARDTRVLLILLQTLNIVSRGVSSTNYGSSPSWKLQSFEIFEITVNHLPKKKKGTGTTQHVLKKKKQTNTFK